MPPLLALQGPVASDLRMIVGSLRMSASLERMGDLARHIATVGRLRYPATAIPEPLVPTFTAMHEAAVRVLRNGVLVIVMLSLVTFAEYPYLFIRTGDTGGRITGALVMPFIVLVLARTGILVGLCIAFYQRLRQDPVDSN